MSQLPNKMDDSYLWYKLKLGHLFLLISISFHYIGTLCQDKDNVLVHTEYVPHRLWVEGLVVRK